MNQLSVIGRLTRDPELSHPKGTAVCRYRIAIDRAGDGADFLDVVSFGPRAVNDARWLQKGRRVAVEGRLHHNEWTDPMGDKLERYECIANQVTYLESPRSNGTAAAELAEATAS